jgi:hypothetical protein
MLQLKLVVPVAVHPDMYPWGVQCLRYAVSAAHPNVPVEVIDLRYHREYVELWQTLKNVFLPDVSASVDALYSERPLKIGMQTEREFHQLAGFLYLVQNPELLPPGQNPLADAVHAHAADVGAILDGMDEALENAIGPADPALVLGVSVYQYLLLHSLGVAHQLRRLYPDATVLLGGDPFDIPTATEVMRKNAWLDGCVVGPGEYALNDILSALRSGASARETKVTRLVNQAFLCDRKAATDEWNRVLESRSDYDAVKGYHGVEYNPSTRAIHVLGRRGCAWALCTFCQRMHVITKEYVFDPSMTLMQREIKRLLDEHFAGRLPQPDAYHVASRELYSMPDRIIRVTSSGEGDPLLIRFDADDADVALIVNLIAWLDAQVPQTEKVRFYSYAPARQLARPALHALAKASPRGRVDIRFGVPIETLNPRTTDSMKKGGNVLGSIKAMKVAADAGVDYVGLYFSFYPLEELSDVQEECHYLERSLHLVAGRYMPTVYSASYRDPIGQDPEKYRIRLHENRDPLFQLLGMDLGATYNHEYEVLGGDALARLQNDYLSLLKTGRVDRNSAPDLARRVPRWLARQARSGSFAYTKRLGLMYLLSKLREPGWSKHIPKLYVDGQKLVRERPLWLGGGFRQRLSDDQLTLLRTAYHPRKMGDLRRELAGIKNLDSVIASLDALGAVVRDRTMIISVANDPARLRELASEIDLADIEERINQLDSDEGVVRPGRERKNAPRRLAVV